MELRSSDEHQRKVLESMPVMLTAFDKEGHPVVWNAECERVVGFSAEEIIDNPQAVDLLYPEKVYRDSMIKEWNSGGHDYLNREWTITCKDGTRRIISWSSVSGRISVPGWATWGVGVDVTERKNAEAGLTEARSELENRVEKRTEELRKMVNLMAGREVRMAELKREIAALKEQLGQTADVP